MSSNNKKVSEVTDLVLHEFKNLKLSLNEHKHQLSLLTELVHLMHAKISDISSKQDFSLNISPNKIKSINKTEDSDVSKQPKLNVMGYFKLKYCESPDLVSNIVSSSEAEKLFKLHTEELSKKKKKDALDKTKASLIYKHIIKDNKDKIKILRSMKEKEESNNTVINSEISENIIDDKHTDDETNPRSDIEESDDE